MAVLTGSTIMYEQILGCMGRQWCPSFGDCRPVVPKAPCFSDFGFSTMIKFYWSCMERITSLVDCWFVDIELSGRLRYRGYCFVLMAACSAFVDTCLFLIYIPVLNFWVWMLDGIDVMIFYFLAYPCGMCRVISSVFAFDCAVWVDSDLGYRMDVFMDLIRMYAAYAHILWGFPSMYCFSLF
ncbi:hypothetical protein CsSME_00045546 [Camellia sinensis var. sinensis]